MPNPYERDHGKRPPKVQTIRETGAVTLYGPEIDIVDTPEFQRLGGIKQLGTSYVVFRGAMHTRFEHSLGTLQRAQDMIDAVNRHVATSQAVDGRHAPRPIDDRGIRLARLAALLHDLPHIPFGHTLEDEFRLLKRHDKNTERLDALLVKSRIGQILRASLEEDELADLLVLLDVPSAGEESGSQGKSPAEQLGEYAYAGDIVANTVCADVLDYIVRDLSACGMPVSLGTRFLDYFEITPSDLPIEANRNRLALRLDKRGMPRPDVESEILKLLTYRYELAERVFFHHAKNAASVMIGEAVALLGMHEQDANFHWLSDDVLLAVLASPKVADALGIKVSADKSSRDRASALGTRVQNRQLYKLAYLGVADDDVSLKATDLYSRWRHPSARRKLQDELAAKAGLESSRVLVHLPDPRMMVKLAHVKVILAEDTVTTFEDWEGRHSDRVRALNRAHERLWRVGVYLHPDDYDNEATARLVNTAAQDVFELPSRYARIRADQPYLGTVYDLHVAERDWPVGERTRQLDDANKVAAKTSSPGSLAVAVELLDSVAQDGTGEPVEDTEPEDPQGTFDSP